MECSLVARFAGVFFTKFYGNSMEILWKFYGNSMENSMEILWKFYESRRVPWHFHRFPYAFQTLRENMWECHGLILLFKIPQKKGAAVKQQTCWVDTRSYDIGEAEMPWAPRMQLWKVSGSHGMSPSYWLLPPNYVALSIPKNFRTAKPDDPIRCVPHVFMKLNEVNKERCPISKDSPDYQGWSLRKPSGKPCQNTTADWIDVSNELEWKVCHWMRQS